MSSVIIQKRSDDHDHQNDKLTDDHDDKNDDSNNKVDGAGGKSCRCSLGITNQSAPEVGVIVILIILVILVMIFVIIMMIVTLVVLMVLMMVIMKNFCMKGTFNRKKQTGQRYFLEINNRLNNFGEKGGWMHSTRMNWRLCLFA